MSSTDAYTPRTIDPLLDELQPHLPAVSVYGPKGVGKTASARRRARSVLALDDEFDLERLRADPTLITRLPGPVLLDEWQRYPAVWDRVRRAVDDGAEGGRYLLTGSSAPRGATVHSGAGRIVGFRLRPMSLSERGVAQPAVGVRALLSGGATVEGESDVTLEQYVDEIVRSGLPGIRSLPPRLRRQRLGTYLETIAGREFAEQGYPVRRPESLLGWLRAYAAATSSTAKYTEILDAATPGEGDKPSRKTTIVYRDVLSQLWLLDPTPAWSPTGSHFNRLALTPKHQLADPALAAQLLGLTEGRLLGREGPRAAGSMLGPLFEALVTLEVKSAAQNAEARVSHLRDRNGEHEVDLVVEGQDGRVLGIEIKLAATVDDRDVRHLRWLRDNLAGTVADLVVVTTGRFAYRRSDGIAVVPAALLGP